MIACLSSSFKRSLGIPGQPIHLLRPSLAYEASAELKPPTLGKYSSLPSTIFTLTGSRLEIITNLPIGHSSCTISEQFPEVEQGHSYSKTNIDKTQAICYNGNTLIYK